MINSVSTSNLQEWSVYSGIMWSISPESTT